MDIYSKSPAGTEMCKELVENARPAKSLMHNVSRTQCSARGCMEAEVVLFHLIVDLAWKQSQDITARKSAE